MALQTRRKPNEAECLQLLADGALVHHDPEPLLDHPLQIGLAPTQHIVGLGVWRLLGPFWQFRRLGIAQSPWRAGIVPVRQAGQAGSL